MIVTCSGYTAKPLPTGEIQLVIEEAKPDAIEDRMSLPEIESLLKKGAKAVYKLSTRKRDPLPLRRGKGRPYGLRSEINQWLAAEGRFPTGMGTVVVRPVFA